MTDAVPVPTRNDQLRLAAFVVLGLLVAGVVLGLLWAWWTPAGPPGVELKAGTIQIDESETFAAGDGRYAVLTALVGAVAAVAVWLSRSTRGPLMAFALGAGGLLGAWVTGLVGHLAGGGTNHGPANTEIPHLPLNVHLTGLIMLEGAVALLLYSVLAAFAVDDDLGRPDPVRDALRTPVLTGAPYGLVQPQYFPQDGWADGNAPGLPQQNQFPPQDPGHHA